MLFVAIIGWITDTLNFFYGLLPPWSITIGSGLTPGASDDNFIHNSLVYVLSWDRFIPIHDCFLPIIGLVSAVGVGLGAFKAIKFLLSLVPTINAGG